MLHSFIVNWFDIDGLYFMVSVFNIYQQSSDPVSCGCYTVQCAEKTNGTVIVPYCRYCLTFLVAWDSLIVKAYFYF